MRKKLLISMCSATLGIFGLATASAFGVFAQPVTAEAEPTSYALYQKGAAYDNNHSGHKTFTWVADADAVIPVNDGDEVASYVSDGTVSNGASTNVMNTHSDGTGTTWYAQYGQPEYYYAGLPGGAYRGYELTLNESITVSDYDLFTFDVLMNVNGATSADAATQLAQQQAQLRGDAKDFPVWVYLYGSNGTENVSVMAKKSFYGIDFYTTVSVDLAESGLTDVQRIAICTHYANGWNKTPNLDGGDYFTLTNFNVVKQQAAAPLKTLSVNDNAYLTDNSNSGILVSVLDGYSSASMTRGALPYGKDPVPNSDYKYQTGRITTGRYVTLLFEQPIYAPDYKYADIRMMIWPQGAEGNYLNETATSFTLKGMKYATASLDDAIDTFELKRATWTECRIELAKYADEDGYISRISFAYVDNDENGHAEGTTQSQYSINIVTHDIDLVGYANVTFAGADVETQKVLCKDKATKPADPEKDGYTFGGWTLDGQAYDFDSAVTGDITLEAVWNRITLGETLHTMNVNLGGKISAIFKYSMPAEIVADDNAYVSLKINGRETQTLVKDAREADGYYFFEVDVAAAEMTMDITIQLFDGDGGYGAKYVQTVRGYADYILENGTTEQIALVKAMLNYGAYAQIRFDVNTQNLANQGCETDITDVAVSESKTVTGAATGFAMTGYDLILESETTIRLNFTAEDIETLKITVAYNDGTDRLFTLVSAYDDVKQCYYVDIPNIAAALLDREYTVKVVNTADNSQYEVKLSALCYISGVLASNDTTDAQKNVMKALYLYNQAANEFFKA